MLFKSIIIVFLLFFSNSLLGQNTLFKDDSHLFFDINLPPGFNVELIGVYMTTTDSFWCKKTLWTDGFYKRVPKTFEVVVDRIEKSEINQFKLPVFLNDNCVSSLISASLKLSHDKFAIYNNLIDFIFVRDPTSIPIDQKVVIYPYLALREELFYMVSHLNKVYISINTPIKLSLGFSSCEEALR